MSLVVTATIALTLPLAAPTPPLIDCDAPDHTAALQALLVKGVEQTDPNDARRFQHVPPVSIELTCPEYRLTGTLHAFGAEIVCPNGPENTRLVWTTTSTGVYNHGPDVFYDASTLYPAHTRKGTAHGGWFDGSPYEGFGGGGLEIRGCKLQGPWHAAAPNLPGKASAIVSKRAAKLYDVEIWNWAGDGINLDCDVLRGSNGMGDGWSECSGSILDDVAVYYTRDNALLTKGGDSNGHNVTALRAYAYKGWCVRAAGMLASSYDVMCHGLESGLYGGQGAILQESTNAKSRYSGYTEGHQLIDVAPPGVVYSMQGGLLSERTKQVGDRLVNPAFGPPSGAGRTLVWPGNEQGVIPTASTWDLGGDVLRFQYWPLRGWRFSWRNSNLLTPLIFTDRSGALPEGRAWLPQGYLAGAGAADVRWEACPPAADPATRPLASVVHCSNPVLGQALEWVVVTSSTSSARIWAPH